MLELESQIQKRKQEKENVENRGDKTNYDNWVPPEKRVAIDEFFDLA